jgi:hypothetical protein
MNLRAALQGMAGGPSGGNFSDDVAAKAMVQMTKQLSGLGLNDVAKQAADSLQQVRIMLGW